MKDFIELIKSQNINGLVALAAILSPVIVSIITLIAKHWELKTNERMTKWNVYYKDAIATFSELLDSVGRWLADARSDEEVYNVMSALNRSFVFADKQLSDKLNSFYFKLDAWNNDFNNADLLDDCQKYSHAVAVDINRRMSEVARMYTNGIFRRLLRYIYTKIVRTS